MSVSSYAILRQLPVVDDADPSLVTAIPTGWFGDYADDEPESHDVIRNFTLADAMAASGDYFVTLATRLDKLAQGLPRDSAEQIELEHQVELLFYMQDHYDLVAKYKRR